MANERKTENIVRKHFEKFSKSISIEEQKSDIPKIDKLLKFASKKGGSAGYPEFIITLANNSDFLIVIECKADIKKHESKSRNKYGEYAVDGALLYASFLSKEYDVLSIAVSGQTKTELKVSHFLHLKNQPGSINVFGNKLLDIPSYLSGYLKNPEKERQDYFKLLDFSKDLNETLHHHKIEEDKRSLLISCILIALDNPAFAASYTLVGTYNEDDSDEEKKYKTENASKELANLLVDTVINQLSAAGVKDDSLENLRIQFSYIRTDTSLSRKQNVLRDLIKSIDLNIKTFIKTYEYFDVLGQLYIEFLRYANSDAGLGIVLTPPHITELFAELADVNKNSIIYDNCTGTGGFLISAMKKMILNAKDDKATIRKIKQKQLYGVEYQSKIFALAVSNMYIHQDGKTNITQGSCFDDHIVKLIKSKKPTVGLLNPPYKADKKNDIEELAFVLNNLECLVEGGVCICIVPMSCALAQTGKMFELKEKLLELHTLEAVLSMPDELFINSDVGVVSCVMVFTAHKPHPKNKETFFGYFKDDGFEKRKNKGRIDTYGQWAEIKEKWVKYYRNRKEAPGLSVKNIVSASDEWCAEAYMETDYSNLGEEDYVDSIKNFVAFQFLNQ